MKTKLKEIKTNYDNSCNEILSLFCDKQEIKLNDWAGGNIGTSAIFENNCVIDLSDIIFDIETEQPKGLIFEWQKKGDTNYAQFINVNASDSVRKLNVNARLIY